MLREQASVLRALADSFDVATIRHQLLDLAARCDELARSIEADAETIGRASTARTAGER
ncbi:MAG: hypothetical protein ACREFI_14500 [Stellaceae bacterium]